MVKMYPYLVYLYSPEQFCKALFYYICIYIHTQCTTGVWRCSLRSFSHTIEQLLFVHSFALQSTCISNAVLERNVYYSRNNKISNYVPFLTTCFI